jgi:hypothetical protein
MGELQAASSLPVVQGSHRHRETPREQNPMSVKTCWNGDLGWQSAVTVKLQRLQPREAGIATRKKPVGSKPGILRENSLLQTHNTDRSFNDYSTGVGAAVGRADWLALWQARTIPRWLIIAVKNKVIPVQAVEAIRVARGWGSHIFRHSAHSYAPAAFYYPGRFLVLISIRCWIDPNAHSAAARIR